MVHDFKAACCEFRLAIVRSDRSDPTDPTQEKANYPVSQRDHPTTKPSPLFVTLVSYFSSRKGRIKRW